MTRLGRLYQQEVAQGGAGTTADFNARRVAAEADCLFYFTQLQRVSPEMRDLEWERLRDYLHLTDVVQPQ